ncbi:MAG TPA: hypothetical protein VFS21_08445, partial [Roseiflexaceae bacterium]|nr:hypothetical protein [Roseiflexaceae bacterium]
TPLSPSVVYRAEDADALDAVYEGRAAGFSYAREGHPNASLRADKLAWTGMKDTGRGATLSEIGYEMLTRPKSFHLRHTI